MMMTGKELALFRKSKGLKQSEFGGWLAEQLGQDRPYAPSEVSAWEKGHRPVSYAVQAAVYKALWEATKAEIR